MMDIMDLCSIFGTEPKCKVYIGVKKDNKAEADETLANNEEFMRQIIK